MSTGTKIPYRDAMGAALALSEALEPYCARVLIAGSLRRQKPEVGDLELVISPRTEAELDMFGDATGRTIELLTLGLQALGITEFRKNGTRFKQFTWQELPVDLFIATPATWGCVATLRTGSADFSHWLVSPAYQGGACPVRYRFAEGRIFEGSVALETPEERDVFALLGLEWIEPVERIDGRWKAGH